MSRQGTFLEVIEVVTRDRLAEDESASDVEEYQSDDEAIYIDSEGQPDNDAWSSSSSDEEISSSSLELSDDNVQEVDNIVDSFESTVYSGNIIQLHPHPTPNASPRASNEQNHSYKRSLPSDIPEANTQKKKRSLALEGPEQAAEDWRKHLSS